MIKVQLTFTKRELGRLADIRQQFHSRDAAAHRLKVAGSRFASLGSDHPALLLATRADREVERLNDRCKFEGMAQWLERTNRLEDARECREEGRENLELLKAAAILKIETFTAALKALAYARANACLCRLEALADFLTFAPVLLTIKEMPAIAIHRAANAPNQEKRGRALNGITQALALER